ncbi:MAG: hypothetical protein ACYCZU_06220 [Devosia sp.]
MALTSNVGTRWLADAATRYRCASEFRGALEMIHAAVSLLVGPMLMVTLFAVPVLWAMGLL